MQSLCMSIYIVNMMFSTMLWQTQTTWHLCLSTFHDNGAFTSCRETCRTSSPSSAICEMYEGKRVQGCWISSCPNTSLTWCLCVCLSLDGIKLVLRDEVFESSVSKPLTVTLQTYSLLHMLCLISVWGKVLFWVDRISIYFHSAFSSCSSCLLAWTSCCLMYAGCAFARPVCSDFWRPCLISRLYFYTYSSAADFRPIDVVIDSDGFIIPAKADQEFQWLCSLGETGEGRGGGGEEMWASAPETPQSLWSFYRGEDRERDVSCFVFPLSQVNYTFRIY